MVVITSMVPPSSSTPASFEEAARLTSLTKFERSDCIPELRGWPTILPYEVPILPTLTFVIDANRVLAAIRRKAGYASPDTRTPLEEAVDAGILRLFGPMELVEHVRRNLPDLLSAAPLGRLEDASGRILERIRTIAAPSDLTSPAIETLRLRDRTDVPYAQVFEYVNADAILTHDRDFEVTGYRLIRFGDADPLVVLRDYCRAVAIERTRSGTMTVGGALGGGMAKELWSLARRVPTWVLLLIGGAAAIALLNPRTREAAKRGIAVFVDEVLPPLAAWCAGMSEARERALAARNRLATLVPSRRRALPLRDAVFQICVHAARAISVEEIEAALQESGRKSTATNARAYLKRVLRTDGRVVEFPGGAFGARAMRAR